MRLFIITFFTIFLNINSYTQEISKHLSVTIEGYTEIGRQCISTSDGYLISCINNIPDSNGVTKVSLGLLRLDESLHPVWSKTYHSNQGEKGIRPNGTVMEVIDDTIFVAALLYKPEGKEIRMMSINLKDGTLLHQKDIIPQGATSFLFCNDMLEIEKDLVIYGGYGNTGDGCLYFIKLDNQFNELEQNHICDNYYLKRGYNLKALVQGGYVLVYGEEYFPGTCSLKIARLDEQFNIVYSKELPQTEIDEVFYDSAILPTEDAGYFLYWHEDLSDSIPFVYPHTTWPRPPVVYKLDSLFNVEWEYVFVSEYECVAVNPKLDSKGNLLASGASLYFYTHDYFTDPSHSFDGWGFLMSPEGDLLWERSIADSMHQNFGGRLWDVIETNEGYLFVGDLNLVNPTGVPFLNDPDVWLLTLDKNGCWNGNCNQYIIITGDSISTTDIQEIDLPKGGITAYPNPANNVLHIECEGCQPNAQRKIEVFDFDGRKMMEVDLFAPKSTINLSNLNNGTYLVVHTIEGRAVETLKVIVHH